LPPARPSRKQPNDDNPGPPTLSPGSIIGLTAISAGVFLYVWALMWGNWIKKVNPASHVATFALANIIPGALFYLNLPTLLLAKKANDAVQLTRSHIALVLWGTIALVSLAGTGIAIFLANRQIGKAAAPHNSRGGPGVTA
jgi:hypothetical protein